MFNNISEEVISIKKYVCVMQDSAKDCGVCCLLSIVQYYGGNIPKEKLRVMTNTTRDGVNSYSLLNVGRELGFDTKGVNGSVFDIDDKFFPCIAHVIIDNKYKHFVVVYKVDRKKKIVIIADPAKGIIKMNEEIFTSISTGNFFFFTPSKKIPILKNNNIVKDFLFNFIYQNKLIFIYIIILSLIYTILNLITSFNFQFILENSLMYNSKNNLYFIFIVMIILSMFKAFSEYFRNYLLNFISCKIDYSLFIISFSHVLSLPYLYYKNRTTGDVLSRINDMKELKEYFSHLFVTVFVDLLLVILGAIFLFSLDSLLMLVILLFCVLYYFISLIFNKIIIKMLILCKNEDIRSNSYMVELINGNDTIKGMNILNSVVDKFSYLYDRSIKSNYKLLNMINIKNSVNNLVNCCLLLICILLGSIRVINGDLSLGNLITFNSLIYLFWEPIKNLLNLKFIFEHIKVIINRINDILSYESEVLFDNNKLINKFSREIVVKDFSYCFSKNNIINDFSLNINYGERVVICGKSGIGKSTLARAISGFLSVERGKVFIDGKDINDFNLWGLREDITYVSQNEFLFNDTIFNNINLSNTRDFDEVLDISKDCLVDEFVCSKNNGYFSILEENGCNLSGGEKQRIVLARTFLKNSSLYILDESFSQIDIERERIILKNIFSKYPDKTFIVISHRCDNNDLFDKVVNLELKNEY